MSSLRTSPPIAALEIHPYCAAGIWYAAPVADVQSGFPYSNVDVLQDYMGISDSLRLPTYLSLEAKVYRDFPLRISYRDRPTGKQHKIRIGLYSLDVTNRQNPHDVYSNVESPAVWPV